MKLSLGWAMILLDALLNCEADCLIMIEVAILLNLSRFHYI